jgi:hypothetical protein
VKALLLDTASSARTQTETFIAFRLSNASQRRLMYINGCDGNLKEIDGRTDVLTEQI